MRRALFALLAALLGCAPAPSRTAVPVVPRHGAARSTLPAALRPLIPERGLYAAGGGLSSPPWRVLVTPDGDVRVGVSSQGGASSLALSDERRATLDPSTRSSLFDLAERVRRERRPPNLSPTADYDEILVLADGDDVFMVEGFGPIRGGAAEEVIKRLRQVAGLP